MKHLTTLREKIARNGHIVGSWINTGSPVVAEIMAASGFDWLVVDAEHSAVDVPQAQAIFQAIAAGNPACVPMVRLPHCGYAEAKRYLDAGARGVIGPLVNDTGTRQELVDATYYPPIGRRGVGFGRSHGYGFDFDSYMSDANEEILCGVQIEHADALPSLDAILEPKEVHTAFVGPYDLSASLGVTAQFDHPSYTQALEQIVAACGRNHVWPGIHVVPPDPEQVRARIDEGYQVIAYSLDITLIGTTCRSGLRGLAKLLG